MRTDTRRRRPRARNEGRHQAAARGLILFVFLLTGAAALLFCSKRPPGQREPELNAAADLSFREDEASGSIVDTAPGQIPDYSGEDVILLRDDRPGFTEYDRMHIRGESFREQDSLGRCGTAAAMLDRSMMPKEKRGPISSIRPSGWNQAKYPGMIKSEPPYLYNRCHLIAYALTGQDANPRNLITGTRYMNTELMLPYEIRIAQYLDHSDNHVLYRVSPYFRGRELLARGVEIEALSVEDRGEGVSFHIFIYNVQPGIELDYRTGKSRIGTSR